MQLPTAIFENRITDQQLTAWDTQAVHDLISAGDETQTARTTERAIEAAGFLPEAVSFDDIQDDKGRAPKQAVIASLISNAKKKRHHMLVVQAKALDDQVVIMANDGRSGRRWVFVESLSSENVKLALFAFAEDKPCLVMPHSPR